LKLQILVTDVASSSDNLLPKSISMNVQLVVFDLAGTTVKDNKDVHRVLQHTLAKHDVQISIDDANDVMGIPKPVAIRSLLEKRHKGSGKITTQWVDEIHKQFVGEMVWFYETSPGVEEKEGVSHTFRELKKRGVKIALDTGFSRLIVNPILKRMSWLKDDLIDCSVTSDEVLRGRPFPDLIFEAMKQTGIRDAASVIKVGDTASDIQEGKAAGCGMTIGITSGAFSSDALKQENPTHLIDSIPHLLNWIN
jgi:phosphonatase-like hydrolase